MALPLKIPYPPKIYAIPHELSIAVLAAFIMVQPSVVAIDYPIKSLA